MEVGHNHNGTSTMGLIIRSLELLILRGQGEMVPVMSTRRTCGLIYKSLRDVAEGKREKKVEMSSTYVPPCTHHSST